MLNLQTKFEVFRCTRYESMNGGTKCRKLWWFGVTQGPSAMSPLDRAHTTSYSTLIKKTMRLSCTVFDRPVGELFVESRRF